MTETLNIGQAQPFLLVSTAFAAQAVSKPSIRYPRLFIPWRTSRSRPALAVDGSGPGANPISEVGKIAAVQGNGSGWRFCPHGGQTDLLPDRYT